MRFGCVLPTLGPLGGSGRPDRAPPSAPRRSTTTRLWVADRLLYPLAPRTPYPATPDGSLPEYFKRCMDPVEALTFAAAHTRRITLGTSVLNMPFYNPVVLARRLATLDVLSGGRLARRPRPGLVGRRARGRGRGPEGARVAGRRVHPGAQGHVGAGSGRVPGPALPGGARRSWASSRSSGRIRRIYLAGLRRAGAPAGGPPGATAGCPRPCPIAALGQMVPQLHAFAREAGRDPRRLEVIYLAGAQVTAAPARRGQAGPAVRERGADPRRPRAPRRRRASPR